MYLSNEYKSITPLDYKLERSLILLYILDTINNKNKLANIYKLY